MKKFVAFLMALGMVLAIIPMEDAQGRGRGRGRSGGFSKSRSRRTGKNRDKKNQLLQQRRVFEDEDSILRDRTRERRDNLS